MWMIVLYWLVGFIVSVLLVLPFVIVHQIKTTSASAGGDIRSSL